MEYGVFSKGEKTGSCSLQEEGLYWRVTCRCRGLRGLARLYAGTRSLGVLNPEAEISLHRRLSKRDWPELPPKSGQFSLEPESGHWKGVLAGVEVEGELAGDWLMIPYDPEQPCPCEPLFCFFEIRDGKWCINLKEAERAVNSEERRVKSAREEVSLRDD